MGDYIPQAPISDEARKNNQNLPGMGGVFNHINCNLYHYGANNPVKYTDPDGRAAGDKFNSIEEAASDFALTYNDDSIHYNVEYFAAIYEFIEDDKKYYSYNIPNKGDGDSVTMDLSVSEGQTVVSTIHAHAAYDSDFGAGNNIPSPGDFNTMIGTNSEYVSTPNGSLIRYNSDGTYETIRTDINSDKNDPSRKNEIFSFSEDVSK